jgi:hypothetical protein
MVAGSEDALTDQDAELTIDDVVEGVLDAVLTHAEDRIKACGEDAYPFTLRGKALTTKESAFASIYAFLLCLSHYGKDAAPGQNGAKLFEDVCAYAVAGYLGCVDQPADKYVFGFPRRIGPPDFVGAVDELCRTHLREGKPNSDYPDSSIPQTMKDAGLDIVAWLPFPDGRSSKLILFGQCATGKNWQAKVNELQPIHWMETWLARHPKVRPVKAFFVPHAVSVVEWEKLAYYAGIFFDRFRIAYFAEQSIPDAFRDQLEKWAMAACTN